MNRRQLIKQAGFAAAAFAMSRDLFARTNSTHISAPSLHNIIYLGSNENPYGPSKSAQQAMMNALLTTNRYQWVESSKLVKAIAQKHAVTDKNVLLGAGSSELLGLTTQLASLSNNTLIAPDPTFRIWTNAVAHMGMKIKWIPLTATKDTDLAAMQAAINTDTGMIYLCNPNNPTGIPIPDQDLRDFIKAVPHHIIILMDEAYTEFEDTPSTVDMTQEFPNLVVAKTFSKIYGLAGARVGYLLGNEKIITQLGNLQPWQNAGASAVSVAAALATIQDQDFVTHCRTENAKSRGIFQKGLADLGLTHTPSVTSFAYFDTANYPGGFAETLEKNNITGVRSFEENSAWKRLSIGTAEEMEQVIRVLKAGG